MENEVSTRTVTCAWCGNHYRSCVPEDLDKLAPGLQGSHCASDVVLIDGKWMVRGGYGSESYDMELAPRMAETWLLLHAVRRLTEENAALRTVVDAADAWRDAQCDRPTSCGDGYTYHGHNCPTNEHMRGLIDAVDTLRKHRHWMGELDDEGLTHASGALEAAKMLRMAAKRLEELATAWERWRPDEGP